MKKYILTILGAMAATAAAFLFIDPVVSLVLITITTMAHKSFTEAWNF